MTGNGKRIPQEYMGRTRGWFIITHIIQRLVVWNHGMDYDFPETVGNLIIPTDEGHDFSER